MHIGFTRAMVSMVMLSSPGRGDGHVSKIRIANGIAAAVVMPKPLTV